MQKNHGFTLLELSIVLVIIGLLIGGVLVGRDMIRNAELQTIISDVDKFKKSAKQFRDKYNFLPGDLPNAEDFWDTDGTCPDGDTSSYSARIATCNGDGNGRIAGPYPTSTTDLVFTSPTFVGTLNVLPKYYLEALRAWQHMANANLLNGNYSGMIGSASNDYVPGTNIPQGPRDNTGYAFFFSSELTGARSPWWAAPFLDPDGVPHTAWMHQYGHIIEYGAVNNTMDVADGIDLPALTAEEALFIDSKIDDGKPGVGNVLSFAGTQGNSPYNLVANARSGTCATTNNPPAPSGISGAYVSYSAVYDTTVAGITCALIFVTGF